MPFILRGVNLLGINSVSVPRPVREQLWPEIARDLDSECLRRFVHAEAELNELPGYVDRILKGQIRGRVIVKLQ
jgi:NADPH:quinone reductase-like Zn-dependent oxidoreductase